MQKLRTDYELKELITRKLRGKGVVSNFTIERCFEALKKIELPTDEEIDEKINDYAYAGKRVRKEARQSGLSVREYHEGLNR